MRLLTKIKMGLQQLPAKIKANMWRSWGALALSYIIFWWYILVTWYFPLTNEYYRIVSLNWVEAMAATVFITIGLGIMLFLFLILWVTLKR